MREFVQGNVEGLRRFLKSTWGGIGGSEVSPDDREQSVNPERKLTRAAGFGAQSKNRNARFGSGC